MKKRNEVGEDPDEKINIKQINMFVLPSLPSENRISESHMEVVWTLLSSAKTNFYFEFIHHIQYELPIVWSGHFLRETGVMESLEFLKHKTRN